MIEGVVNATREPVVTLAVQGPSGQTSEIEAVIDTGFTGFLTLPPGLISELGLPFLAANRATLADGSEVTFPSYVVAVLWGGQTIYVEADAADTTPLVGMRLLDSHSLYVEIEDGGRVVIQAREYPSYAPAIHRAVCAMVSGCRRTCLRPPCTRHRCRNCYRRWRGRA